MSETSGHERAPEQIDGVPVTSGTVQGALADDGSGLKLTAPLARRLGRLHAGADGRHRDEPSPFHEGDLVGSLTAVCAVSRLRPDAGEAGVSAIHKAPLDGPAAVNRLGIVLDQQADRAHHGGLHKALYAMDGAEVRYWSKVLGGVRPGALGENLVIEPGPAGGIDDVELGAVLSIGDPRGDGLRARVTGVRNPCPTFARGVGRGDWVEVFSSRNRVGVYLAVLKEGTVSIGDEVRVLSSPGHRVTCTRWFAHHDPRDAQALLNSEAFGNCVIAPFTKKYVQAAAHEPVG
ncbi:MOSC domain-containing protein YiiM [Actinomyces ruminicola]|uniref:MOSC domain-containing protein YiiM n=1 Tax=Actinomyces ruminicola TaxID=332524 RepID=A0A1H0EQV3_9ACTO|nr:MOSC domain-containing protein [Actinomyces ruminicola]SDN84716.1 MOSC domain-containing protein YiiM [Actinomyces ruminicola]